MGFSVVNNVSALNALNRLDRSNQGLGKTLERLSSGLRINSASDDASGLALAEQAASDTSGIDSGNEKAAINSEYQEILREINRLSETVDFNGKALFSSTGATFDIQVGASSSSTNNTITLSTNGLTSVGTASGGLGLTGSGTGPTVTTTALLTKAGGQAELDAVRGAIDTIAARRGGLGATRNRLQNTINVVSIQAQTLTSAESQIRDADIATEIVNLTKFQVLNQTGLSALAQANAQSQRVLSLIR